MIVVLINLSCRMGIAFGCFPMPLLFEISKNLLYDDALDWFQNAYS